MRNVETITTCKVCGHTGTGSYCSFCGQSFATKRISVKGLLQEIFHFFTHFEKGYAYTLKQLCITPGQMQRAYIEGNRIKYQKPFGMFFICVTIAALIRYWISNVLMTYYHVDVISEANFFHEYMVIMHIVLFPVYSFITYMFFYRSGSNYAEIGVMLLYTLSFLFLVASVISICILIWPAIDTAYIEFPIFTAYFIITFMNYFKVVPRWEVLLKSIAVISVSFFISDRIEEFIIHLISKS